MTNKKEMREQYPLSRYLNSSNYPKRRCLTHLEYRLAKLKNPDMPAPPIIGHYKNIICNARLHRNKNENCIRKGRKKLNGRCMTHRFDN